tara:strand:+ start:5044 stop:5400 length:357 start_codon:yes stop_codon:yes gene_type:complete
MSAAPPQMRRIPDEQFFDLRSWSADKAEDYGEKASMIVQTILLSKSDQVNRITSELHDGNIVLIDYTPLTSDQETLHKILAELERAIADIDGDLVGVSQKWIIATPNGVRVAREKLKD